jgi:hypothetical protein
VHARAFADGQVRIGETERTVIYKVSVTDPRAAIAAIKVGEAELVDVRPSKPWDEEIRVNTQRD